MLYRTKILINRKGVFFEEVKERHSTMNILEFLFILKKELREVF